MILFYDFFALQKYEKIVFSHHFSIAIFLRKLKIEKLMTEDLRNCRRH